MPGLRDLRDKLLDGVISLEERLLGSSDAGQFEQAQFLSEVNHVVTARANAELSETIDDPHAVYAKHLCAVLGELMVLGGIKTDA
ncbi:hypothetical protein KC973_01975 [Candidatus Saccharibacteria bacterium]|nr:hypothetical protein [Candidatus Saccharibacteria bacterium]